MHPLHDPALRGFASDNAAGAHPEALAAIAAANGGHLSGYGDDPYTSRLQELIREHFGARAEAFPVFNGTGANVTALTAMVPRWGAVVCASASHVHTDEAGAPERISGLKLLPVPAPGGKLTPELVETEARGFDNVHRAQPLALSLTQSTELGTVYTVEELAVLCEHAHAKGMLVHLDGARLANAAAHLGVGLGALSTELGVDVLSFGGTKNGLVLGEAIVVLNPDAVTGLPYLRKMHAQLASKMRFISAQLIALLEDGLWLRSAQHANAMAQRLRTRLDAGIASGGIQGLAFTQPTEANALFATLPREHAERLRERFRFYDWDAARGEVRWMCAFDTAEADVDAFAAAIEAELAAPGR